MANLSGLLTGGSFNGLTWGPGTDFHIANLSGLDTLPGVRSNDAPRARSDGDFSGDDFLAARTFAFDLLIIAADNATMMADLALVEAAFQPQNSGTKPFLIFGSSRQLNARCRKRAPAYDSSYKRRTITVPIEMYAPDPRVYDVTVQTFSLGLANPTAGFGFPLSFNFGFGSGSATNTVVVNNTGNYATMPTFSVNGPCTNPTLTNMTTGQALAFTIVLGSGDVLSVTPDVRSVLLNGAASRRGTLVQGSRWFALQPGANTLSFTASGYSAGATVTGKAQAAYI